MRPLSRVARCSEQVKRGRLVPGRSGKIGQPWAAAASAADRSAVSGDEAADRYARE